MSHPDFLELVIAWTAEGLPGVRVAGKFQAAHLLTVPAVRVRRTPGGQTSWAGETRVLFDVDVLSRPDTVWDTTLAVQERLVALSARFYAGALIDEVRTHSGPGDANWDDPALARTFGIYQLASRA